MLTGGSHTNTISARTGHYANRCRNTNWRLWWKLLELVIDVTFYAFDGPRHCKQAWDGDGTPDDYQGSDFILIILTIVLTIPICMAIILPISQLKLAFFGPVKIKARNIWGSKGWHRWTSFVFGLTLIFLFTLPLFAVTICVTFGTLCLK